MLHEFLNQYRTEIIEICRAKVAADGESKPTSALLNDGLPLFYDELIEVLKRTVTTARDSTLTFRNNISYGNAASHGKESLRLGYSISQVVHSYGAVCQSITEFVQTKTYAITAREFHDLNLSLDCAIAESVTEFEKVQSQATAENEVQRIGFLMHELRNLLSAASAAYQMIQKGSVGVTGITSAVLGRSHERMERLIETAEAEIRFHGQTKLEPTPMRLIDVAHDVRDALTITGNAQEVHLKLEIDPAIQLTADRHLLFSALSNLVSNGVKFSKKGGQVSMRAKNTNKHILIEVEDECGGLLEGQTEDLFQPFVQKGHDKSGMGLGLSLSRQAILLNHGTLTVRNLPGKGCVFMIKLPRTVQAPEATA